MKWYKVFIRQTTCLTYIYVQARSAEEAIVQAKLSRNVRGTFTAVELENSED